MQIHQNWIDMCRNKCKNNQAGCLIVYRLEECQVLFGYVLLPNSFHEKVACLICLPTIYSNSPVVHLRMSFFYVN